MRRDCSRCVGEGETANASPQLPLGKQTTSSMFTETPRVWPERTSSRHTIHETRMHTPKVFEAKSIPRASNLRRTNERLPTLSCIRYMTMRNVCAQVSVEARHYALDVEQFCFLGRAAQVGNLVASFR
ncbi:unnamed protein product, partial [Ectocarpus sp. 13 AM-2016]